MATIIKFCKFYYEKSNMNFKDINNFINYLNENNCPEISVDVSNMSIFEAIKFIALSSTYHYCKYPNGKLKFLGLTDDVKKLASSYAYANFEMV